MGNCLPRDTFRRGSIDIGENGGDSTADQSSKRTQNQVELHDARGYTSPNPNSYQNLTDVAHSSQEHQQNSSVRQDQNHSIPSHQFQNDREEIVVAVYSHHARVREELSFEKFTRFRVISKTDQDWWYVENLSNDQVGYVGVNFVVDESSPELTEWYFGGITRAEAERYLKQPALQRGTYLVRKSSAGHGYTLCVKNVSTQGVYVSHFRVYSTPEGFYIHKGQTFQTLQSLIDYYSDPNAASGRLLYIPCPKAKPQTWDLSRQTKDKWEIDRNQLTFMRKLGSGNFGDVWHGMWNDNVEVAIKSMKDGAMKVNDFIAEASIMKKLRHENILVLYAVCTTEAPILIVMEYMNNGSLLEVLRKEGDTFPLPDLIVVCAQVAAGMEYLEEKNLIHRDLAARNVLMDTVKVCKIADFGLARVLDEEEYSAAEGKHFPVKWTAPEGILYNSYSIKSDVWSFGILMMEVITLGAIPYPGMKNNEVASMVPSGYRMKRPVQPIDCPDVLYDLMVKCWAIKPEERLTFQYLANFLDDYAVSAEAEYKEMGM